jgi:hypothetical protein
VTVCIAACGASSGWSTRIGISMTKVAGARNRLQAVRSVPCVKQRENKGGSVPLGGSRNTTVSPLLESERKYVAPAVVSEESKTPFLSSRDPQRKPQAWLMQITGHTSVLHHPSLARQV